MNRLGIVDPGWGLTILRVAAALVFLSRGYGKWIAGPMGVTAFFAGNHFPFPGVIGPAIMIWEPVGAALLILGVAVRWVGLLYAIEMAVAIVWVRIPTYGWLGSELERMLLAGGIILFLAGGGKLSLEGVWQKRTA